MQKGIYLICRTIRSRDVSNLKTLMFLFVFWICLILHSSHAFIPLKCGDEKICLCKPLAKELDIKDPSMMRICCPPKLLLNYCSKNGTCTDKPAGCANETWATGI